MDDSLKKIISEGLSGLFRAFKDDSSNKDAIGIDVGSSSIKVVQLKRKMVNAFYRHTAYWLLVLMPIPMSEQ